MAWHFLDEVVRRTLRLGTAAAWFGVWITQAMAVPADKTMVNLDDYRPREAKYAGDLTSNAVLQARNDLLRPQVATKEKLEADIKQLSAQVKETRAALEKILQTPALLWSPKEGAQVPASYEGMEDTNVNFRLVNHQTVNVPLEALKVEDARFLDDLKATGLSLPTSKEKP